MSNTSENKITIDEPQFMFREEAEPLMRRVRELQNIKASNYFANLAAHQILCAVKNLEKAFEAAR